MADKHKTTQTKQLISWQEMKPSDRLNCSAVWRWSGSLGAGWFVHIGRHFLVITCRFDIVKLWWLDDLLNVVIYVAMPAPQDVSRLVRSGRSRALKTWAHLSIWLRDNLKPLKATQLSDDTQLMHLRAAKWPKIRRNTETAIKDAHGNQNRCRRAMLSVAALWKVSQTRNWNEVVQAWFQNWIWYWKKSTAGETQATLKQSPVSAEPQRRPGKLERSQPWEHGLLVS